MVPWWREVACARAASVRRSLRSVPDCIHCEHRSESGFGHRSPKRRVAGRGVGGRAFEFSSSKKGARLTPTAVCMYEYVCVHTYGRAGTGALDCARRAAPMEGAGTHKRFRSVKEATHCGKEPTRRLSLRVLQPKRIAPRAHRGVYQHLARRFSSAPADRGSDRDAS